MVTKELIAGAAMLALTSAATAGEGGHLDCVEPSIETIGILVDSDGLRFMSMVGEPVDFMIDAVEYPEDVLPIEDMTDLGFISFGIEDLYRDVQSMFDGDLERARSDLIQSGLNASILKTNENTYVSYNGDFIDWSESINKIAFMNAYGTNVSDNVNKLVNALNTGMFKLNNAISVCSIQTTKLSSQDGMFRPQMR